MTLETMNVIIEAETKKFREEINKVQKQIDSVTKNINTKTSKITSMFKKAAKALMTGVIIKKMIDLGKHGVNLARTVEASTQQINRLLGNNTSSFFNWVNANARAYNMSKADAISYGATYGNLLSSFLNSTSDIEAGTKELLKSSSVVASATGRTMNDVMERIRSGLLGNTEAIEDLGINVNVAMLESTKAFKKLAGDKSWNQLDFKTQQQIRLMAILEQSSKKYGDTVANNTNSSLQSLSATFKDIALNIGNALLPVLNVVLPVIQSVANKIEVLTAKFATFMEVVFGKSFVSSSFTNSSKSVEQYADSLDGAAASAKKLKGSTAGFDELNIIPSSSDSSSSSSGNGGLSGYSGNLFGNNKDEENKTVENIDGILKAVEKLKNFLDKYGNGVIATIAGIVGGITAFMIISNVGVVISAVTGAIATLGTWLGVIGLAFAEATGPITFFTALFGAVNGPIVAVSVAIGALVAAIVYLWKTSEEFRNNVKNIINSIMSILKSFYDNIIQPIFNAIIQTLKKVWENGVTPLLKAWINFVDVVVKVVSKFFSAVSPVFTSILNVLGPQFTRTLGTLSSMFATTFNSILNGITVAVNVMSGIVESLSVTFSELFKNIKTILNGIVKFIKGVFKGDVRSATKGVIDMISGIVSTLGTLIKAPINAVIGIINGLINSINDIGISIPKWVPGFGGKKFSVNIPKIQYLAQGGIASSATYGVFGEAGTEAVIPLKRNTQGIEMIANKLLEYMPVGNGDGATYVIQLVLEDGTVLAKKIIKNIKDYEVMTGKPAF